MSAHPELEAEQAYIDHAYACLEATRVAASRMTSMVEVGRGGTEQARFERDVIWDTMLHRLAQLDLGAAALCFGRIDTSGAGHNGDSEAATYYIGRVAVADESQEPVVVDWRAPIAEPFYRATGRQPMGLARRRHFATRGRQLLGIEDELFGDALASLGIESDDGPAISGHGALLSRPRDGAHGPAHRHRRHHPGRTGRGHPGRDAGCAGRAGRPGHRQDRRRPAPRRLPALHAPLPARGSGCAGHRPQPPVPRLHRTGPAVARRGRCRAGRARRSRARRAHQRVRPGPHGSGQGRPAHRARAAPSYPQSRAPAALRSRRSLRSATVAARRGSQSAHRRRGEAPLSPTQRRAPFRRVRGLRGVGCQRPGRHRGVRGARAPALRSSRCAKRSSACGRCSRRPSCCTICSARWPCCATPADRS